MLSRAQHSSCAFLNRRTKISLPPFPVLFLSAGLLLYHFIVILYIVIIWSYCLNLSFHCNTFVFEYMYQRYLYFKEHIFSCFIS